MITKTFIFVCQPPGSLYLVSLQLPGIFLKRAFLRLSPFLGGFSRSSELRSTFPEHAGGLVHSSVPFWEEIGQGGKIGAELILMSGSSQEFPGFSDVSIAWS